MTTAVTITEDGLHVVFTWSIDRESKTSGDEDLSDKFFQRSSDRLDAGQLNNGLYGFLYFYKYLDLESFAFQFYYFSSGH